MLISSAALAASATAALSRIPALPALPGLSADDSSGSSSMVQDLFQWQVPPLEKVIRTIAVYVLIAILLRLVGKRTLAQLNSMDFVVMFLLSNVVQNAIIGNDNSLIGGALGATVLMAVDWALDRLSYSYQWIDRVANGRSALLVRDGKVDEDTLHWSGIRHHQLVSALRHQGADGIDELKKATLESTGAITVELKRLEQSASKGELDEAVTDLRAHIDARFAALQATLETLPGAGPAAQHEAGDPR